MAEPVAMCFSGGKDSALAMHQIRQHGTYEVVRLLTTVTSGYDRVSMHGVRRVLLHEQSQALGLPLTEVEVPPQSSNEVYEREMGAVLQGFRKEGVRRVAFGDIFLADLRRYREQQLARVGLRGVFPLWKQHTGELARSFVRDGFKATTVCVNLSVLDASFVGRAFDDALLSDLPDTVDPCGEYGEFHTFVFDGPVFGRPIAASTGSVVERDGFAYCDLYPQRVQRRPNRS